MRTNHSSHLITPEERAKLLSNWRECVATKNAANRIPVVRLHSDTLGHKASLVAMNPSNEDEVFGLFVCIGGYQGGRDPYYERDLWDRPELWAESDCWVGRERLHRLISEWYTLIRCDDFVGDRPLRSYYDEACEMVAELYGSIDQTNKDLEEVRKQAAATGAQAAIDAVFRSSRARR